MNRNKLNRIKAIRKTDSLPVADPCYLAKGFFERLVGLMGESELQHGEGLWIEPCNSIHTFFMKFPIDVLYLDREGKVVEIQREIKPWRVAKPVFNAHSVIELPSGSTRHLRKGDELWLS